MAQLSDPTIILNGTPLLIVPNSVTFTEGLGESEVLTVSGGNGTSDVITSQNVETKKGMLKFSLRVTPDQIEEARTAKLSPAGNVLEFTGTTGIGTPAEKTVNRTFQKATLITNYEVNPTNDGVIELEFEGTPPTT